MADASKPPGNVPATQPVAEDDIGAMIARHQTLEDIRPSDTVAFMINEKLHGVLVSHFGLIVQVPLTADYPALKDFLHTTKFGDIFDADLNANQEKIDAALAQALAGAPIADLREPSLLGICNTLVAGTSNQELLTPNPYTNITDLLAPDNPWLSVPGAHPKIGDILVTGTLKIDGDKLQQLCRSLDEKSRQIAQPHTLKVAKEGISVYDYLQHTARFHYTTSADLTAVLKAAHYYDSQVLSDAKFGASKFYDLFSGTGGQALPAEVEKHLKELKLSQIITSVGVIDADKLRDAIIEPVKGRSFSDMKTRANFIEGVFGPEVAAAIAIDDTSTPEGKRREQAITTTTLGSLLSQGDAGRYESARAAFEKSAYPPEARAADVIGAPRNPWPQFKRPDGITVVPYSFNTTNNTPVPDFHAHFNSAFSDDEKQVADYLLWRWSLGAKLDFEKVATLPKPNGHDPNGILFYNADLSDGLSGLAVGSLSDSAGKPNQRVDVTIDFAKTMNSNSYVLSTTSHEDGHAAGFSHPHSPRNSRLMPGTRISPRTGQPLAPELTENVTNMSYEAVYTPGLQKPVEQITPGVADYIAQERVYGARPANPGDDTYTLRAGYIPDVYSSRDTHPIWISPEKRAFAQTIVDTGGTNTIDLSTITNAQGKDGKPVKLVDAFDLSQNTHVIRLKDENGKSFIPEYLSVRGTLHNAIATSGTLIGTPGSNVLEVKQEATLNGGGGKDTLIGGVGNTVFTGGRDHQDIFRIRAPADCAKPHVDTITDYIVGKDKIVAPEGTAAVKRFELYPNAATNDHFTMVVFYNAKDEKLKALEVHSAEGAVLKAPDIESVEGKKLTVTPLPDVRVPPMPTTIPAQAQSTDKISRPMAAPRRVDTQPASTQPAGKENER